LGTYNSRQLRPHREPKLKEDCEQIRDGTIERRVQVVKLKPLSLLRDNQSPAITREPTKLSEKLPETDEETFEIKKEIASDEEDTNRYTLKRYTERLMIINGIPSTYNYSERTEGENATTRN